MRAISSQSHSFLPQMLRTRKTLLLRLHLGEREQKVGKGKGVNHVKEEATR